MTSVPVATTNLTSRLERAQHTAAEAGMDALFITPGPGLRYLTGFDARYSERLTCLVLPAHGDPVLVVPALEAAVAQASPARDLGIQIADWTETEDPLSLVSTLVPEIRTVGLDDQMRAITVLGLRETMPEVVQRPAGPVLAELQVRKDPAEVEALRAAGQAIDEVHAQVPQWLRAGRTEAEVGADISAAIFAAGHVSVDFVIVAAGPNGASPHHDVSDRAIRSGDVVVVDIGGTTAAGYCSDSTRTYAVGQPDPEYLRRYQVLQQAQQAAFDHVRPGVTAESVDAVARDVLTEAGMGEYFIHRTGHGIGLSTHEEPYLVSGNTAVLEPGMTFSIEPGFYIPGRYGARIEDIVVATDGGAERLNHSPRDLVVVDG